MSTLSQTIKRTEVIKSKPALRRVRVLIACDAPNSPLINLNGTYTEGTVVTVVDIIVKNNKIVIVRVPDNDGPNGSFSSLFSG
jgi:hypothetical protein